MKWGTSPDTDPMILLQDVYHARKSGGEDGQLWDNGRGPRQELRLMTPRPQQITTSTRALHEDDGHTASPSQAKQTLLDLCEGLAGHYSRERRGPCTTPARDLQKAVSPFSHTIDASHAATLRGTTRIETSVTPHTIAGYPCGDSARDLRRPVIDQRATGSRTISTDLDPAKTADLAQKRSHKRRRAGT